MLSVFLFCFFILFIFMYCRTIWLSANISFAGKPCFFTFLTFSAPTLSRERDLPWKQACSFNLETTAASLNVCVITVPAGGGRQKFHTGDWSTFFYWMTFRMDFYHVMLLRWNETVGCQILATLTATDVFFLSFKTWTSQPWTDQWHEHSWAVYWTLPGQYCYFTAT